MYSTTMFEITPPPSQGLLELIAEMSKATRIFQQESVFCEGITFNQFTILDQMAKTGGEIPLSELHGRLEVEKSTTTRLVAPLLKKGLVEKNRSKKDSRAANLSLTKEGRETLDRVRL